MAGNPPSGTVTFLLTDLEGSTRMWEQDPEAMKAAMVRHDEILEKTFAEKRVLHTFGVERADEHDSRHYVRSASGSTPR